MIDETNAKKYCKEDISLIKNYAEALADTTQMWLCHHINGEPFTGFSKRDLKKMKMYYNRPASELKFVTKDMHNVIHHKNKVISVETKTKMSNAKKGKVFSAEHRAKLSAAKKGKKLSAETKAKMSTSHIGHIVTQETRAKISATEKITKKR